MGWQPIETAPRDGTVVDLWSYWPERHEWRRSADSHWDDKANAWRLGGYLANQYLYPPIITHWMPMPDAPFSLREG